jgi:tRNA threonylcarbamoyl adenosine modification protein YjeE
MERELIDPAATRAFGAELAAAATAGTVIALIGDLGAGKTELVRGFMAAMPGAVEAEVASPSYALVHRYESSPPVWHLDLYRLENAAELDAIGGRELFDPIEEITIVEWANRFPDFLPASAWTVRLEIIAPSARSALLLRP